MKQRFRVNYLNASSVSLYCDFDIVDEALCFYSSIELVNSGQWKNMFQLGDCSLDNRLLLASCKT